MALDNHAFCWNGIVSSDVDRSGKFYEAVLGWTLGEHKFPNGETANLFSAGDWPRAHLRPCQDGETDHWSAFLRVEDVDKSTERSTANGGSVLLEPNDIAPGRFSVVAAPSGAPLALYHEANEEEAEPKAPAGEGSVHWTELHSSDVEKDVAWLKSTFNYETQEMPIPMGTYYLFKTPDGTVRCGACQGMIDGGKSTWLTWIHVPDCDAAAQKISELGGRAPAQGSDYPGVGRMALVADPFGADFGIITPFAPENES